MYEGRLFLMIEHPTDLGNIFLSKYGIVISVLQIWSTQQLVIVLLLSIILVYFKPMNLLNCVKHNIYIYTYIYINHYMCVFYVNQTKGYQ